MHWNSLCRLIGDVRWHLEIPLCCAVLALNVGCAGSIKGLTIFPGTGELYPGQPHFADTLQIRYLGAGGFLMRCGTNAILTAPFYSTPGVLRVGLLPITPKTSRVDQLLPEVGDIDSLLVGHAHYDHLMDVPHIVNHRATNAVVYGNSTMSNLLAAAVCPSRLVAADRAAGEFRSGGRPGAWVPVSGGKIRFMALKSEHAPHFKCIKLFSGEVRTPRSRLPKSAWGWKEGQTLAFLIDFLRDDGTIQYRIVYHDAAVNHPTYGGLPALTAADQKTPEVVILCMASFGEVRNYPDGLVENMRPRNVVVGHWEDFFRSQLRPLRVVRLTNGREFMRRLGRVHPSGQNFLPVPGAWMHFRSP